MNAEHIIDVDTAWKVVRDYPSGKTSNLIRIDASGLWHCAQAISDEATHLLNIYAPLVVAPKISERIVAHLGQTLDGFISTKTGASHYVTGPENIVHLHRMRALSDAVLVGANTVSHDDPKLTTRLVPGNNPVRVVIDPDRRLQPDKNLFTDPSAQTLVLCTPHDNTKSNGLANHVEIVEVPTQTRDIPVQACLKALRARGLKRLFIEGGGDTVSRFVKAEVVDHLQITVAPVLFGDGRPGLRVPPVATPDQAMRPSCRQFKLGSDVLFDCKLSRAFT